MVDQITFVICGSQYLNQTLGSILYDKWGISTNADIRFVDTWDQVKKLDRLKEYTFFVKSGTVFSDIHMFFKNISPALIKTGLGHIVYDKDTHSVYLHDQALLIKTLMIPESIGLQTSLQFPNFTRAKKDIHHDHTPVYVKKEAGYFDIEESKFGQDVIAGHLEQYQYFNNFPKTARQYKVYLPNPDVGDPFVEYKEMIENTLWIFNNEKLKIKNSDKVLCTAGGIGWMLQTAEHIHICDISRMQLKFVQQCLDNWDGNDFGHFVYNFLLENKPMHWHLNLQETQESNKELLKDKDQFIDAVNVNFEMLVHKYRDKQWKFDQVKGKKIVCDNVNILERATGYHLDQINVSNIMDFKYNFINDNIDKWKNLISPATKAFIRARPTANPYKDAPCNKLDLGVPLQTVYDEILNVKKWLVPHREGSGIGWSSFCIHGKSHDATREDTFYNDDRPHKWTDIALEHMPNTIKWLKTLGYKKFQRVRVMCLAPKGFINIHRDQTESKLTAVNISITNPIGCKFYLEHHGALEFEPGTAYQMNLVNYHAVINDSNVTRYHIIVHGDR